MKKLIILFIAIICLSDVSAIEIEGIKNHLSTHDPHGEPDLINTIEHCEVNKNQNFFCIFHNNRDLNNRIVFGKITDGKISNTIFDLNDIGYVYNIHSARFLDFKHLMLLEVYVATTKGNGNIIIYKIEGNNFESIFSNPAVDSHAEMSERILTQDGNLVKFNWNDPSKNPKGQVVQLSNTFKGSILKSEYLDLNHDGYEDLMLKGFIVSEIENENSEVIQKKEKAVKKVFIWNPQKQSFIEDKTKRVGF